jgi:hypothetical protein
VAAGRAASGSRRYEFRRASEVEVEVVAVACAAGPSSLRRTFWTARAGNRSARNGANCGRGGWRRRSDRLG